MKRFLSILVIIFVLGIGLQLPWVKYSKSEYAITMRDSVKLHTVVYTPRWGSNHPILIQRTPYSCYPYGDDIPRDFLTNYLNRSYILRGYILVFQDVRGRFMSEGEYENIRPADAPISELTDSYDTVEWLINNIKGNNGCVGFTGCSYPGFYAMQAGLCGHPAIKAVSPQAPVTDWFMGDDLHHNGVMMIADSFRFMPMMSHTSHTPSTEGEPTKRHDFSDGLYDFFLKATRDSLRGVMHPSSFWDAMAEHPNYDEWWQRRDVRTHLYNIKPAVLVVGGTFDAEDCFGAWNTYKAIVSQSPQTDCRLVMGPWAHGAWKSRNAEKLGDFDFGRTASTRYYVDNFELPFFEYHLRGKGSADALPKVSVFLSGQNSWITSQTWLPEQCTNATLYLDQGELKPIKGEAVTSMQYTSDPNCPVPFDEQLSYRRREYMIADQRFTDGREDVLRYISEPLVENYTIVGPIKVNLNMAITTTDIDLAVRVIDLHPEDGSEKSGYQMLVRGEVMRARYRNSFTNPTPIVPQEPTTVSFTMPDIAHTFKAGHRIMVCVQSSWFPLAECSPQQFVDMWSYSSSDFLPSTVTLFNDSSIKFNTL